MKRIPGNNANRRRILTTGANYSKKYNLRKYNNPKIPQKYYKSFLKFVMNHDYMYEFSNDYPFAPVFKVMWSNKHQCEKVIIPEKWRTLELELMVKML